MKLISGRFGRHADASDLYKDLGVSQSTLPEEGMPERLIDGVRVYVKPLVRGSNRSETFAIRVMAICDDCGRHLAAGRLHQHSCVTKAGAR